MNDKLTAENMYNSVLNLITDKVDQKISEEDYQTQLSVILHMAVKLLDPVEKLKFKQMLKAAALM